MSLWNILFSAVFLLWMFIVAGLLWWNTMRNGTRVQRLQNALVDSTLARAHAAERAADAAHASAEAAGKAAEAARILAGILEKRYAQ